VRPALEEQRMTDSEKQRALEAEKQRVEADWQGGQG
jgi:hypothetical protein